MECLHGCIELLLQKYRKKDPLEIILQNRNHFQKFFREKLIDFFLNTADNHSNISSQMMPEITL